MRNVTVRRLRGVCYILFGVTCDAVIRLARVGGFDCRIKCSCRGSRRTFFAKAKARNGDCGGSGQRVRQRYNAEQLVCLSRNKARAVAFRSIVFCHVSFKRFVLSFDTLRLCTTSLRCSYIDVRVGCRCVRRALFGLYPHSRICRGTSRFADDDGIFDIVGNDGRQQKGAVKKYFLLLVLYPIRSNINCRVDIVCLIVGTNMLRIF